MFRNLYLFPTHFEKIYYAYIWGKHSQATNAQFIYYILV